MPNGIQFQYRVTLPIAKPGPCPNVGRRFTQAVIERLVLETVAVDSRGRQGDTRYAGIGMMKNGRFPPQNKEYTERSTSHSA